MDYVLFWPETTSNSKHLNGGFASNKDRHLFTIRKTLIELVRSFGILVDYCDQLFGLFVILMAPIHCWWSISKWCNATFLQICSNETSSSTSWMAWGCANEIFGWTINFSLILCCKINTMYVCRHNTCVCMGGVHLIFECGCTSASSDICSRHPAGSPPWAGQGLWGDGRWGICQLLWYEQYLLFLKPHDIMNASMHINKRSSCFSGAAETFRGIGMTSLVILLIFSLIMCITGQNEKKGKQQGLFV